MALIDDYANDLQRALIDAVQEPVFRQFIDQTDIEVVTVDKGDGTQAQAQALRRSSVKEVLKRVLDAAKAKGVNIKELICSKDGFDLCGKLAKMGKLAPEVMMKDLYRFLTNKWTRRADFAAQFITAFPHLALAAALGKFLFILAALGFVNREFIELCNCERPAR
jgi:hypothetical protein